MGILERKLAERTVGDFQISISTDLGLESLCGVHPEIAVDRAPVLDTRLVMINLRTLVRNIYGAVEGDVKKSLTARAVLDTLMAEMQIIESTVLRYSEGRVNVMFYMCSHASLKRKFPYAIMRQVSTDIQLHYAHLERDVIRSLLAMPAAHDIRQYDVEFTDKFPDTIIVTHEAVDLLARSHFTKLTLLETHTGALKSHLLWNSKLTKGRDLIRMPFCKFTLQVFGDNGHLFTPQPIAIKNAVMDMATADNWSNISTRDRIVTSINKVTDAKLRSQLTMLL